MVVRLRAIGECAIDVGPTRVGPDAELAFAVLLVLVMAGGHTVTRRRLTDLLWPGVPDERARHKLRRPSTRGALGAPVSTLSPRGASGRGVAPNPLLAGRRDVEDGSAELRAPTSFVYFLAGYVPTLPHRRRVDREHRASARALRRAA